MSEVYVWCATGHRPDKLGGFSPSTFDRLVKFATTQLDIPIRPHGMIVGMALGWDQAVAVACIEIGIPVHAYIPFKGQETMWPNDARELYDAILAGCERVKVVCEGGFAGWKMQRRNEAMVDDSQLVLALWNGSNGGTANCVEYAKHWDKTMKNVWQDWEVFNQ